MKELEVLLNKRWILKSRDKETYYKIRDALGELRKFTTEKMGCQIIDNSLLIKMEKIPVIPESFMGIQKFSSKEEYAYLCILLMFLEDRDAQEQFILSQLTEYITANLPGEISDWTLYTNRRKLIRVLRFAVDQGIVDVTDGKDEAFMDDEAGEVLYENTGASRYFMKNFSKDIMEYTKPEDFQESDWFEVDEDRGFARRHRVYKRLIFAPGMYKEDGSPEDFEYLKYYGRRLSEELEQIFDCQVHIHRGSAYLLSGDDCRMGTVFPGNNSISDILLLCFGEIRKKIENGEWKTAADESCLTDRIEFENLIKEVKAELTTELEGQQKNLREKQHFLELKQDQYQDAQNQIKAEEDRKYEKEKELKELIEEMQDEADTTAFEEHAFMKEELEKHPEEPYKFELHQQQFDHTKEKINKGTEILAETDRLERQKDDLIKEREKKIRELDTLQRKVSELEAVFVQTQNEWKEALYQWNGANRELVLEKELLRELSTFAESYEETSDFAEVRQKIADVWIAKNADIESGLSANKAEKETTERELEEVKAELSEWENQKEPQPERSEAVIRNRQRLDALGIPYQEFYKVIEFGNNLDEEDCNRLEEALLKMGILDALVIDEQYKEQVLHLEQGCEDHYLFSCKNVQKELQPGKSLLDVLELNEEVNDIFSNQRLTGILGSIAYDNESMITVAEDGTYRIGVLAGTVTGEYEAGFLGTKARERHRQAKMEACRQRIAELEEVLQQLEEMYRKLFERKVTLRREYENLPKDTDMREALQMMRAEERACEQIRSESDKLEERIRELIEILKEKKKKALEIADSLYLTCSYEIFKKAKSAAEEYGKHLISLIAAHEMFLRSLEYLKERREHLGDLDADMEQIRYDLFEIQKELRRKMEEQTSIQEQLRLTDYEEIKDRLDACIKWLQEYPERLRICVSRQTHEEDEVGQLILRLEEGRKRIEEYEKKTAYFSECYEQEKSLHYVEIPEEIPDDAGHVRSYLESDVKAMDKDSVIRDLNKVYFENRGFLTDYHLMQNELFAEAEQTEFPAKRLDISARYQGVKITFSSLLTHLEEDIEELENLIKDGDRELFEDILANTVSRKIRGKINASNTWVQKMNSLMNGMNTSSGLKLSLRWRSKTAEQEDQLDTKELVDLLKKDYRLMSEEEASRLSAHFRSKVAEARRNARDSAGMISFYQIMKDTLDYRKWFEFQLFSQKNGERQKELTNSVFGTFSGGEKAMSMYVPLFSAVVAKYQGGREDAPRLISLDEAFAGVDNKNIRDMFRLMTEFGFDFIINSQVLWGDCDTLDALAIYQLIRPGNAKFVTVMPYLWNGKKKELLEREEEVEQRGAEIGQQ